jgi:hypothetical protein
MAGIGKRGIYAENGISLFFSTLPALAGKV